MTAEIEYSYLDINVALTRVIDELMNRAVRVKKAVSERVERLYYSFVAGLVESLMDLTEENLISLNSKVTGLQNQRGLTHVYRRAVLFTKALEEKILRVYNKWYENIPVEYKREELPNVEYANHLGGEVTRTIPETWDDRVEKPQFEVSLVPADEPVAELVTQEVSADEPVVEANVEETAAENISTAEVTAVNTPEEVNQYDYVPEPQEISMENKANESTMAVEHTAESVVPVEPAADLAAQEVPVNEPVTEAKVEETPVAMVTPESISNSDAQTIEDRIAQILNDRPEAVRVSEAPADEEADREMMAEGRKIVGKTEIMAKLHRFSQEKKKQAIKLAAMEDKLAELREKYEESKKTISENKRTISDLTKENANLTQSYEKLSFQLSEGEAKSAGRIAALISELKESRQARLQEREASKAALAEMDEAHAKELQARDEQHAEELKKAAAFNAQLETVWGALISEEIDEPEEGYQKAA